MIASREGNQPTARAGGLFVLEVFYNICIFQQCAQINCKKNYDKKIPLLMMMEKKITQTLYKLKDSRSPNHSLVNASTLFQHPYPGTGTRIVSLAPARKARVRGWVQARTGEVGGS